ncbi:ATP-binding protein (plasmid) [Rhizobium sp. CB3060]|uniref:ATP-binding protein n=1 Tax=Rhizobium sp. CB3060 TaxID=3138255 RepID=UPI0021A62D5F|nr:ATP-binding protein [Rhizobium tropici]UWU26020.1 ATP-binding protein [Rhizobium tropici]
MAFSQLAKRLVFSAVIGGLVGLATWYRQPSTSAQSFVTQFVGYPVDLAIFAGDLLGYGDQLSNLREALLGPLLGLTVGVVVFVGLALSGLLQRFVTEAWPSAPDILDNDLIRQMSGDLSPFSKAVPFIGREKELRELMVFAGQARNESPRIRWVLGREGIGKTRLAVEWLRKLEASGWDVGVLRPDVTARIIARTRFRKRTAILIDEPDTWPDIWTLLDAIARKNKTIAVLVTDHVYRAMPTSVDTTISITLGKATEPPMMLSGLDDNAISSLWDAEGDMTIEDIDGRPLYAVLSKFDSQEIVRRVAKRIETAESYGGTRSLLVACLAAPVRRDAGLSRIGASVAVSALQKIFESEDRTFLRGTLPRVTPSLVADEITLRLASEEGRPDLEAILSVCVAENVSAVEHRIGSLWQRELPAEMAEVRAHLQDTFDALVPGRLQELVATTGGLVFEVSQAAGRAKASEAIFKTAVSVIADAADRRPTSRAIRLSEIRMAPYAVEYFLRSDDFQSIRHWARRSMRVLTDRQLSSDIEILCSGLEALRSVVEAYGRSGRLTQMELWASRLLAVVRNSELRDEAKVATCVVKCSADVLRFLDTEDPDRIKEWAERLSTIGDQPRFRLDKDVRMIQASGLGNAAYRLGFLRRWDDMETYGHRVLDVASTPGLQDVGSLAFAHGQAAVNAMFHYGRSGRLQDLERWSKILSPLVKDKTLRTVESIALLIGEAAIVMTYAYRKTANTKAIDWWIGTARDLVASPALKGSDAVRLKYLRAATNVLEHYGLRGDKVQFIRWEREILRLVDLPQWKDTPEVLRSAATTGSHATFCYDDFSDFGAIEAWETRLVAISEHNSVVNDSKTQFQIANAFANAIHSFGRAGRHGGPQTARWREALTKIGSRFPADSDIQALLTKWNLSSVDQFFDRNRD